MAKVKELSITNIDNVTKEKYVPTTSVDWGTGELIIKKNISFAEVIAFVDKVVGSCFVGEESTYRPELKDYLIRAATLLSYSNVRLPDDVSHQYDIVYKSGLYETVLNYIDSSQFGCIVEAINEKIGHLASVSKRENQKRFEELFSVVEALSGQINEMFGDVRAEDIDKIVGAITNNALDENKLVRAYMDIVSDEETEPEVVSKEEADVDEN